MPAPTGSMARAATTRCAAHGGNDMFVFSPRRSAPAMSTPSSTSIRPARPRPELHKSVFTALAVTGPLLSGYLRANAAGTAQDANDHIVYDTVTGNLYYDADANGASAAIHFATLTGLPSLSADGFCRGVSLTDARRSREARVSFGASDQPSRAVRLTPTSDPPETFSRRPCNRSSVKTALASLHPHRLHNASGIGAR